MGDFNVFYNALDFLYNFIELAITMLPLFTCIAAIIFIISFIGFLIGKRENHKKLVDFIKAPAMAMLLGGIAIAGISLIIFYLPKQVIPSTYDFEEISIKRTSDSKALVIKDKEAIDEFKKIFDGYACRRRTESDSIIGYNSDDFFIYVPMFDNGKMALLQFAVKKDYAEEMISDSKFTYVIKGNQQQLKISDFINRHLKI